MDFLLRGVSGQFRSYDERRSRRWTRRARFFVECAAMSWGELSISGSVVRPGEADWDAARMAWNLAADQRPEAVVLVESADDIAKTVRFAAEHGLQVAAQGTGHGAVALGSLENTLLVKTER